MSDQQRPLLSTERVAELLDVSPRTLEGWRLTGEGPRYVRVGSRTKYDLADVLAWIEGQKFNHTAQESEVRP